MTSKKTPAKGKKTKTKSFTDIIRGALTRKWQSTAEIAAKAGLAGDDGEPTNYHKAKTRAAIKTLIADKKAEQKGAFKTARYRKAA